MKKILILLLLPLFSYSQFSYKGHEYDVEKILKDNLKFSTVYGAVNGGTSISDVKQFSIIDGLQTSTIETPYDYSKGFINSMMRASQADAAARKTADLLKKNPNGVKIPKLTEAANQQVTDYLITKKPEIAAAHQALRTGTEEEKLEATELLNKVDTERSR